MLTQKDQRRRVYFRIAIFLVSVILIVIWLVTNKFVHLYVIFQTKFSITVVLALTCVTFFFLLERSISDGEFKEICPVTSIFCLNAAKYFYLSI